MTVEFGVLGSVEAEVDGRSAKLGHARQRGVLAVLAVDLNRTVTTDQLVDRVWGDRPPRQAVSTLRGYLSRLRQALVGTREAAIARQPGGYALTTAGTVSVDLHGFRHLLTRARATDDDIRAAALFEQALRLWRAEPFATLDTPWFNALRDTLVQERHAADLDLVDLRLRLGRHATLPAELSARAEAHPLDERLAGQLMLALHRCGRSAEALDHYHRTRGRLVRELGIDPGKALRDIQSAILRPAAVPTSAPAPRPSAPPLAPVAQLPLSVATFTGRATELARLDELLLADTCTATATDTDTGTGTGTGTATVPRPTVVVSVISGTAGVGKTALAVHWAHRVRHAFPDGQLYVNLRGFDPGGPAVDTADAIRGFLNALGVPPDRVPSGLQAQAGLYRGLLADRRVLVLLDNARDAEQVRPLLPGAPGCVALVTSRHHLAGLAATEGARLLAVALLAPDQARTLLAARLGLRRTAAEPGAVDEIVTRCAGLPLALAITAARAAAQPHLPLTALADELRRAEGRLDALDGGDPASRLRAVLSTSYEALNPDAARLFRLLGLHPGPDISLPAAASLAGLPRSRTGALLTELTRASLLTQHVPGRYACHDLLRVHASELVTAHDSDDARRSAVHRTLDHYLHTAHAADTLLTCTRDPIVLPPAHPGTTPEELTDHRGALAWFSAEQAVLLGAVGRSPAGFDTHTWQLASTLITFLDRTGHWPALYTALTSALRAAQRQDDRSGQATSHRGLGFVEFRLGHPGAQYHYTRARDLFGELGDRSGQARVHQELGRISLGEGHFDEALAHARQALAHYRAARNRGGEAVALNHVGRYRARLGDHRRALADCRRALALAEETEDLDGQAYAWDALGYIHHHLGDDARAVDCYRTALELFRRTGDRYHEAGSSADLGDAHHASADLDAAHRAWARALTLFDELGHPKAAPLRSKIRRTLDSLPDDTPVTAQT
ncbi:BTAD domain-containing putative transcriptional regulator [Streptomyces sp. NPDC005732]|uniref:AfsR/SARP family transcriptional regulator n=1 Tax=Streptomyces sp. NPDC005732 TaxID=3157057 RepID=UPI0033C79595